MRVIISVQQLLQRPIVRFVIVGGFNTALTYGVYCFFLYLDFHYQLALLCEYSVGICVGYILNRHWTFVEQDKVDRENVQSNKVATSFMRYATTYGGVYLGNVVLLSAIVEMGWLSPLVGQIIALALISLVSFVMQKYWVFAGQVNNRDS